MIGADFSDSVTRGRFLRGDATLVIDDLTNPDVAFGNLRDLETGARPDNRVMGEHPRQRRILRQKAGRQQRLHPGRFVGESHAGFVGVFER